MEELKALIHRVIKNQNDWMGLADIEIAPKWEGGTLILRPADPEKKSVEIPLDHFFKKIISVREKLRVLEQKINAHPKLSDPEKIELQQYLTRCYGSLTTFNVLFREDKDKFHGQSA